MYGTYYSHTVVTPRLGNTRPACSAGPKGSLRQPESNKYNYRFKTELCSVATVMYWLVPCVFKFWYMGSNPGSAAPFFFSKQIIAISQEMPMR